MAEVEVYFFVKLAGAADENVALRQPATLEAIKRIGGEPIKETRRMVDTSELNENGLLKEAPGSSV